MGTQPVASGCNAPLNKNSEQGRPLGTVFASLFSLFTSVGSGHRTTNSRNWTHQDQCDPRHDSCTDAGSADKLASLLALQFPSILLSQGAEARLFYGVQTG